MFKSLIFASRYRMYTRITRLIATDSRDIIPQETAWYVDGDGHLLNGFQQFFSEIWVERFDYKEAGPQLLMQAFLQRIVNSGGRIDREYGLGVAPIC